MAMVFKKIANHKWALLISLILFSVTLYWLELRRQQLVNTQYVLGWILFVLALIMASYNLRKKLSVLALGTNKTWYLIHIYGGLWSLFFFGFHAGWSWPAGLINQALWIGSILILSSGLIGALLNKFLTPRISSQGERLLFDRIPGHISINREKSKALILKAAASKEGKPLLDYYNNKLLTIFTHQGSRGFKIFGHNKILVGMLIELEELERYLDKDNKLRLIQLKILLKQKFVLTWQYSILSILRNWTLLHVPIIWFTFIILIVHIITQYAFQMRNLW